MAVSCTTTPSTGGAPNPTQQFCEFWDRVEEAPPADDNAVLVKDDVVALAEDTTVTGSECTDPGAKVELDRRGPGRGQGGAVGAGQRSVRADRGGDR